VFTDQDEIVLSWQSVGQLPADTYYVTTVAFSRAGETWYDETPWVRDTRWTLSEHRYLLDLSDNGQYDWSVRVMRRTGVNAQGRPIGVALSPSSEVRTLIWRVSAAPGRTTATPLPVPTTPDVPRPVRTPTVPPP
jgi:hypothetical protein